MKNRNKPCACGSGVKFKRCCLKVATIQPIQGISREEWQKTLDACAANERKVDEILYKNDPLPPPPPRRTFRRPLMAVPLLMAALAFSHHPAMKRP